MSSWLRLIGTWPPAVIGLMAVLMTALDLVAEVAAKEAVERRAPALGVAGAAVFLAAYFVYLSSMKLADFAKITLVWCVLCVAGAYVIERLVYGVQQTPARYVVLVLVLVGVAYLCQPSPDTNASETPAVSVPAIVTIPGPRSSPIADAAFGPPAFLFAPVKAPMPRDVPLRRQPRHRAEPAAHAAPARVALERKLVTAGASSSGGGSR